MTDSPPPFSLLFLRTNWCLISFVQIKKLWLREVKYFAQDHTATLWQIIWASVWWISKLSFPLHCFCCCMGAQSCPTLCDLMDYSPPGSSVLGIFQARILEWVAISFSRGSSQLRGWTLISCVSCIGRQVLLPLSHLEGPLPTWRPIQRGKRGSLATGHTGRCGKACS